MRFPLSIQFELKHQLVQRRKAVVCDDAGVTLMFVDQGTWTMSEEVEIFRDESRSNLLYRVGRTWDQFGNKNYTCFSLESGCKCVTLHIPNMQLNGWSSLWSVNYEILGESETMMINQESSVNRLLQILFGAVPSVFGFCPSFLVRRQDGAALLRMTRKQQWSETYTIEKIGDISDDASGRSLLCLILLVLITKEDDTIAI